MQNMGAQLLEDLRSERLDALIVVGEEVLYPQASDLELASTEKCILTVISSKKVDGKPTLCCPKPLLGAR